MSWKPPDRPVWLERLIAHADAVGGADQLVSLDRDELLDAAMRSSGFSDFGGTFRARSGVRQALAVFKFRPTWSSRLF